MKFLGLVTLNGKIPILWTRIAVAWGSLQGLGKRKVC